MIAIRITNKREFMGKLLSSEMFDTFLMEEAFIETSNSFHIDGHILKDFYKSAKDYDDSVAIPDMSVWNDHRALCYELIKGKITPLSFKFIFFAPNELKKKIIEASDFGLMEDQLNLGLNIRFQNGEIRLVTGTTISIFTLDKSIEKAWDKYIPSFLESHNISFEELS